MSLKSGDRVLTSWTNGRKAVAHLMIDEDGARYILKRYKARFLVTMLRETISLRYLARKLDIVPRLLHANLGRREIALSFMPGERVLEWVLRRFAPPDTRLETFQSFHGIRTNPVVQTALAQFRQSAAEDVADLKKAIFASYDALHLTGWIHGSADPRNLIYDGTRVFIIDFDHARPCWGGVQEERSGLCAWFGK